MKNFFSIFAVIAVLSCASYEMVSTSVLHEPAHLKDLQGSSLTILPIDINYGAINLTIDLRDVQIRVNGQAVTLQDQYLMEYEDDELGTIGVLDSNIFELAGLDKAKLGAYASERFIALMRGEATYTEPFFRGFGAGDMGHLSNQAINWDYEAVNPPQPVYYGDPAPLVFPTIVDLNDAQSDNVQDTDYVLKMEVQLSSEVGEILSGGEEDYYGSSFSAASGPEEGDYVLFLRSSIYYELLDANGNEVFNSNITYEYPLNDYDVREIVLPVTPGNADAFAKYFRDFDYESIALELIDEFIPRIIPAFSNFYVTTVTAVEIVEEEVE
jgi:hypothetical protein